MSRCTVPCLLQELLTGAVSSPASLTLCPQEKCSPVGKWPKKRWPPGQQPVASTKWACGLKSGVLSPCLHTVQSHACLEPGPHKPAYRVSSPTSHRTTGHRGQAISQVLHCLGGLLYCLGTFQQETRHSQLQRCQKTSGKGSIMGIFDRSHFIVW
jgi:hypothetical protein